MILMVPEAGLEPARAFRPLGLKFDSDTEFIEAELYSSEEYQAASRFDELSK